ncbi:MAG: hypothetical protein WDA65_02930 [Christensenellales bacterium]
MAISTYPITLKAGGTKLCDIKDFPDLGAAPEMLDATTLSDVARVYIAGKRPAGFRVYRKLHGRYL